MDFLEQLRTDIMESRFQQAWDDLPESLQLVGLIAGVLIVSLALQWMLSRFLKRLLSIYSRRTANTQIEEQMLKAMRLPLRYFSLAVVLLFAIELVTLSDEGYLIISRLARSLIIVALFLLAFRMADLMTATARLTSRITGTQVDEKLLPFLRTAARVVIVSISLVILIEEWGYDVGALLTGLGLGGLAFALAAQDTIANLFGFSTIVGDRPFVEGEYIKTPDVEGLVEHVGIRSTRIRQMNQALVTIPNNVLANSVITNWSRLRKRQAQFTLTLAYETTPQQLRAFVARLREMLPQREMVEDKSVVVILTGLGADALEILVRFYIFLPDWVEFHLEQEQIYLSILEVVEEMGLTLAFPTRSIYIENLDEMALSALRPAGLPGQGGGQPRPPQPPPTGRP